MDVDAVHDDIFFVGIKFKDDIKPSTSLDAQTSFDAWPRRPFNRTGVHTTTREFTLVLSWVSSILASQVHCLWGEAVRRNTAANQYPAFGCTDTNCRLDGYAKQREPFQQFYVLQLILYGIHVLRSSLLLCVWNLTDSNFWPLYFEVSQSRKPTFYSLENSHVEAQKMEVFWFRWFFLFQLGDL